MGGGRTDMGSSIRDAGSAVPRRWMRPVVPLDREGRKPGIALVLGRPSFCTERGALPGQGQGHAPGDAEQRRQVNFKLTHLAAPRVLAGSAPRPRPLSA